MPNLFTIGREREKRRRDKKASVVSDPVLRAAINSGATTFEEKDPEVLSQDEYYYKTSTPVEDWRSRTTSRPMHAAGAFVRSIVEMQASAADALGIIAYNMDRKFGSLWGESAKGKTFEEWSKLHKGAEGARTVAEWVTPDANPDLEGSFMLDTVPAAFGSAVGFMVGSGAASKIALRAAPKTASKTYTAKSLATLKVQSEAGKAWAKNALRRHAARDAKVLRLRAGVGTAATAAHGGAVGVHEGWMDAYAALLKKAQAEGRTTLTEEEYETAWLSAQYNSIGGASEAIGAGRLGAKLFAKLDMRTNGLFGKGMRSYAGEIGVGAVTEAAQETFQTLWLNAGANAILRYDEERSLYEGVLEAGGAGGIVGAVFGGLMAAINRKATLHTRIKELREMAKNLREKGSPESAAKVEEQAEQLEAEQERHNNDSDIESMLGEEGEGDLTEDERAAEREEVAEIGEATEEDTEEDTDAGDATELTPAAQRVVAARDRLNKIVDELSDENLDPDRRADLEKEANAAEAEYDAAVIAEAEELKEDKPPAPDVAEQTEWLTAKGKGFAKEANAKAKINKLKKQEKYKDTEFAIEAHEGGGFKVVLATKPETGEEAGPAPRNDELEKAGWEARFAPAGVVDGHDVAAGWMWHKGKEAAREELALKLARGEAGAPAGDSAKVEAARKKLEDHEAKLKDIEVGSDEAAEWNAEHDKLFDELADAMEEGKAEREAEAGPAPRNDELEKAGWKTQVHLGLWMWYREDNPDALYASAEGALTAQRGITKGEEAQKDKDDVAAQNKKAAESAEKLVEKRKKDKEIAELEGQLEEAEREEEGKRQRLERRVQKKVDEHTKGDGRWVGVKAVVRAVAGGKDFPRLWTDPENPNVIFINTDRASEKFHLGEAIQHELGHLLTYQSMIAAGVKNIKGALAEVFNNLSGDQKAKLRAQHGKGKPDWVLGAEHVAEVLEVKHTGQSYAAKYVKLPSTYLQQIVAFIRDYIHKLRHRNEALDNILENATDFMVSLSGEASDASGGKGGREAADERQQSDLALIGERTYAVPSTSLVGAINKLRGERDQIKVGDEVPLLEAILAASEIAANQVSEDDSQIDHNEAFDLMKDIAIFKIGGTLRAQKERGEVVKVAPLTTQQLTLAFYEKKKVLKAGGTGAKGGVARRTGQLPISVEDTGASRPGQRPAREETDDEVAPSGQQLAGQALTPDQLAEIRENRGRIDNMWKELAEAEGLKGIENAQKVLKAFEEVWAEGFDPGEHPPTIERIENKTGLSRYLVEKWLGLAADKDGNTKNPLGVAPQMAVALHKLGINHTDMSLAYSIEITAAPEETAEAAPEAKYLPNPNDIKRNLDKGLYNVEYLPTQVLQSQIKTEDGRRILDAQLFLQESHKAIRTTEVVGGRKESSRITEKAAKDYDIIGLKESDALWKWAQDNGMALDYAEEHRLQREHGAQTLRELRVLADEAIKAGDMDSAVKHATAAAEVRTGFGGAGPAGVVQGAEHRVYLNEGTREWVKMADPRAVQQTKTVLSYLQRMAFHNFLFEGEPVKAPVKLRGFVRMPTQDYDGPDPSKKIVLTVPVITQPHVEQVGGNVTKAEIVSLIEKVGGGVGLSDGVTIKGGVLHGGGADLVDLDAIISDVHDENALRAAGGTVVVIDAIIEANPATKRERMEKLSGTYVPHPSEIAGAPEEIRARDAEYMAAVEELERLRPNSRGSKSRMSELRNTLQRMVEQAARAAGYDAVEEHAPGNDKVYHGSPNKGFRAFEPGRAKEHDWSVSTGEAFHFSTRINVAAGYRFKDEHIEEARSAAGMKLSIKSPGEIREFYLRGKYFVVDSNRRGGLESLNKLTGEDFDSRSGGHRGSGDHIVEYITPEVKELLMSKGFDGIVYFWGPAITEFGGGYEFAVFDPSNIKSADLITRDEEGNIRPLSERFDLTTDDLTAAPEEDARSRLPYHDAYDKLREADRLELALRREKSDRLFRAQNISEAHRTRDSYGDSGLLYEKTTGRGRLISGYATEEDAELIINHGELDSAIKEAAKGVGVDTRTFRVMLSSTVDTWSMAANNNEASDTVIIRSEHTGTGTDYDNLFSAAFEGRPLSKVERSDLVRVLQEEIIHLIHGRAIYEAWEGNSEFKIGSPEWSTYAQRQGQKIYDAMTMEERESVAKTYFQHDPSVLDDLLVDGLRGNRSRAMGMEFIRQLAQREFTGTVTEAGSRWRASIIETLFEVLDYVRGLVNSGKVSPDSIVGQEVKNLNSMLRRYREQYERAKMEKQVSESRQRLARRQEESVRRMKEGLTADDITAAPEEIRAKDAEYMAAVESGDMDTAQRMVDEAAKAAGLRGPFFRGDTPTQAVESGALPEGVESSQLTYPNVVEARGTESGAIYLTKSYDVAEYFAESVGAANRPRQFYINARRTASVGDVSRLVSQHYIDRTALRTIEQLKKGEDIEYAYAGTGGKETFMWNTATRTKRINVAEALKDRSKWATNSLMRLDEAKEAGVKDFWIYYNKSEGKYPNFPARSIKDMPKTEKAAWEDAINSDRIMRAAHLQEKEAGWSRAMNVSALTSKEVAILREAGFDSAEGFDIQGTIPVGDKHEIAVFDPNQIKSADPVTRDEEGNIRPLSERFDIRSDDITAAPEEDERQRQAANAARRIKQEIFSKLPKKHKGKHWDIHQLTERQLDGDTNLPKDTWDALTADTVTYDVQHHDDFIEKIAKKWSHLSVDEMWEAILHTGTAADASGNVVELDEESLEAAKSVLADVALEKMGAAVDAAAASGDRLLAERLGREMAERYIAEQTREMQLGRSISIIRKFVKAGDKIKRMFERMVMNARDAVEKKVRAHTDPVVNEVNEINKDHIGGVVDKVEGKVGDAVATSSSERGEVAEEIKGAKEGGTLEERALKVIKRKLGKDKKGSVTEDFVVALVAAWRRHLKRTAVTSGASDAEAKVQAVTDMSAEAVLLDAFKNREHAAESFNEALDYVLEKHGKTGGASINATIAELAGIPYGERTEEKIAGGVKGAEKVKELIKAHYSSVKGAARSLTAKLVTEAGLTAEQAIALEKIIVAELGASTKEATKGVKTRAAAAAKTSGMSPKDEKRILNDIDKVIALAKLGAVSQKEAWDKLSENYNLPVYSAGTARKMRAMANAVDAAPEGHMRNQKARAMMEFISGQETLRKRDLALAFYYASILSGPSTQIINAGGSIVNIISRIMHGMYKHPKFAREILNSAIRGLTQQGFQEFQAAWRGDFSGRKYFDPYSAESVGDRVAATAPDALQRASKSESKALRAVGWMQWVKNLMTGVDLMFFKSAEEMHAYLIALRLHDKGAKTDEVTRAITSELHLTDAEQVDAGIQAARELKLDGKANLTAADKRAIKRRKWEIIEQMRDKKMLAEAEQLGRESTYTEEPQGVVGALAKGIDNWVSRTEAKYGTSLPRWMKAYIVPFTRTIANVVNFKLGFVPGIGLMRLREGAKFWGKQKPLTPHQRSFLMFQQVTGTMSLVALAMAAMWADDDEDDWFQITALGPKNRDRRRQLMESGWRPYTIRIGPLQINYSEWPIGNVMGMIGAASDKHRYEGKTPDATDLLTVATLTQLRVPFSQGFLSSLAGLTRVLGSDDPNMWKKELIRMPSAFVPKFAKDIEGSFFSAKQDDSTVGRMFMNQLPIVRLLGRPQLNVLGEPVFAKYAERAVKLHRFGNINWDDPFFDLITHKGVFVPNVPRSVPLGDRTMTEDERYEYIKSRGQIMAKKFRNPEHLNRMRRMSKQELQEHLRDVATRAGRGAKRMIRRGSTSP